MLCVNSLLRCLLNFCIRASNVCINSEFQCPVRCGKMFTNCKSRLKHLHPNCLQRKSPFFFCESQREGYNFAFGSLKYRDPELLSDFLKSPPGLLKGISVLVTPEQRKVIIGNDTFGPELNFWLGGVTEEIICLFCRQSKKEMFWPWEQEGHTRWSPHERPCLAPRFDQWESWLGKPI